MTNKILLFVIMMLTAGYQALAMPTSNPKGIALYPQQNQCRNVLDLSGVWNFQMDPQKEGAAANWQQGLPAAQNIAVPGSWNDQLVGYHNYLGLSWYETTTYLTEFGADAISGMHADEDEIFSEKFQNKMISTYLDIANTKPYIVGMHVWNFADFRTAQAIMRVGGMNLKGVFTQDRKPKAAAHTLRSRWVGTDKF